MNSGNKSANWNSKSPNWRRESVLKGNVWIKNAQMMCNGCKISTKLWSNNLRSELKEQSLN